MDPEDFEALDRLAHFQQALRAASYSPLRPWTAEQFEAFTARTYEWGPTMQRQLA